MVRFVLHHPGKEPSPLDDNLFPVEIVSAYHHPLWPAYRKIEPRKGETPLDNGNGPAPALKLRVDEKAPGGRPALFSGALQIKDKKTHGEADLGCRHGYALLGGQRVPKIPDRGADLGRDGIDRLRRRPEERVEMGNERSDRQGGLSLLSGQTCREGSRTGPLRKG